MPPEPTAKPMLNVNQPKYWLKTIPVILLLIPAVLAFSTGFVAENLISAFRNGWKVAENYLDDRED